MKPKLLARCKKADILDKDGQKLLLSVPVELDPLGALMLTVPFEFEIDPKEFVTVLFYDPDMGLVTCKCHLYFHKKMPLHTKWLHCDVLEKISQEQRRSDLKIPLEHVYVFVRPLRGGGQEVRSTVGNISAGGIYLSTTLYAEKGDLFFFTFNETSTPIPLIAEVLRVVEPPRPEPPEGEEGEEEESQEKNPTSFSSDAAGNPLIYGYGCRFINMTPQYEEILRGYIFRKDMESRKIR